MTDPRYERAVAAWLKEKVVWLGDLDLDQVTKVELIWDSGHHYSSYTFEDGHLEIHVTTTDGGHVVDFDLLPSVTLGQFVAEVAALA